jgi:hypothetical protein
MERLDQNCNCNTVFLYRNECLTKFRISTVHPIPSNPSPLAIPASINASDRDVLNIGTSICITQLNRKIPRPACTPRAIQARPARWHIKERVVTRE